MTYYGNSLHARVKVTGSGTGCGGCDRDRSDERAIDKLALTWTTEMPLMSYNRKCKNTYHITESIDAAIFYDNEDWTVYLRFRDTTANCRLCPSHQQQLSFLESRKIQICIAIHLAQSIPMARKRDYQASKPLALTKWHAQVKTSQFRRHKKACETSRYTILGQCQQRVLLPYWWDSQGHKELQSDTS